MSWRDLLRRELGLVFGARVTWFVLAIAALLIGHGFVLAIDLFSAASRSAEEFALMQREMDPLAGVVRPSLGGLQLATSLLLPLLAARGLAIERERKSYGPLALAVGSTHKLVLAKAIAAMSASACLLLPPLMLLLWFAVLGGHVDVPETSVAFTGHVLHVLAMTMVALAAAAGTTTLAQAVGVALAISLSSWAVDAGEGFAALAWLGRLEWASAQTQLDGFEHGVVAIGSLMWFLCLGLTALLIALLLGQIELKRRRVWPVVALSAGCVLSLMFAAHVHRGYDWSEQRRASLPPATVDALRELPGLLRIEVFLDRDDGRRARLEQDALPKLLLARPDLQVDMPFDELDPTVTREADYGWIVVHVGDQARTTRSTARRELSTLLLEAGGAAVPTYSQPPYPGYPVVIDGVWRTLTGYLAYGVVPGSFLVLGWFMTRRRRSS